MIWLEEKSEQPFLFLAYTSVITSPNFDPIKDRPEPQDPFGRIIDALCLALFPDMTAIDARYKSIVGNHKQRAPDPQVGYGHIMANCVILYDGCGCKDLDEGINCSGNGASDYPYCDGIPATRLG